MNKILIDVWGLIKFPLLRYIILLLLLGLFARSFINVLAIILIYNTFWQILTTDNPTLKEWWSMTWKSTLFLCSVGGLYYVAGLSGVLGLALGGVLILLILTGYLIYTQWRVYDLVTTWGAERITGKHKDDFDLKEALKK